eukprot:10718714-Lingulodinium_polyedra.AAC.1
METFCGGQKKDCRGVRTLGTGGRVSASGSQELPRPRARCGNTFRPRSQFRPQRGPVIAIRRA